MSRVLFIDAYDSFSNNIISLIRDHLLVSVEVIKIDDLRFILNDDAFHQYLDHFDAVVAGPGPGHPSNLNDIGLIGKLWHLPDEHLLPVLGICLGFQSLALAFGADIERLKEPRHGMVTPITHCRRDIFEGTNDIIATQYHSLHIQLGKTPFLDEASAACWTPSEKCPALIPLAWDFSDARNGPVLSALRHEMKPYWGVQYHPESVCTDENGRNMIERWWQRALRWNNSRFPISSSPSTASFDSAPMTPVDAANPHPDRKVLSNRLSQATSSLKSLDNNSTMNVYWKAFDISSALETIDIVNAARMSSKYKPILLESGVRDGKPLNSETGRFSIIAVHDAESAHIRFSTKDRHLVNIKDDNIIASQESTMAGAIEYVEKFVADHRAQAGSENVPFWGGLVGFFSYEAGLETINVAPPFCDSARPDVWFVFVERSIVIDHITNTAYVQTIRSDDISWVDSMGKSILAPNSTTQAAASHSKTQCEIRSEPNQDVYCEQVCACQSRLRRGSSYELCLTDQTLLQQSTAPWDLYQKLRRANPAPFGAYLDFKDQKSAGLSIVGSSPERFVSWSRQGQCQFRPIKGTVRKGPEMTRAKAEEILNSDKEQAENLMIVDLIRHDLNGVPGIETVHVPKLMCVEEYETVFQLVSVIEGQVSAPGSPMAALTRSLPPGSMTGAPKKRSCELLKEIEGQRSRGIYSGVLGYMDVGGGGDFSVVIRTAFKWANEDVWRIGAGGAVTALSEPEAEWEEMLTKRERLLDVFKL
ncbi:Hypothetical protein R9X50_00636000 [Acrodontium crateriforme]|uniref:aminodeoxychorismate synthase n=1 Tax=Acrodontium crateriforme TaxID=150365 RepID=A0AAQ3RC44_9PEZI|nr:Hypothetical protein R9X50_00636000 [Acrodontium crateriforme]